MPNKPRTNFVTYVIRMPDTTEGKRAITCGIRDLVETHQGEITGQSNEDEMTLAEMFEKRLSQGYAEEAREEAAELAAQTRP